MKNINNNEDHIDTTLNRITKLKSKDFDNIYLIVESIEFNNFKAKGIKLSQNVVLIIAITFLLSITIYLVK